MIADDPAQIAVETSKWLRFQEAPRISFEGSILVSELANSHLLSHKQNKLLVLFIGLAQQTAELAQKSRIFA